MPQQFQKGDYVRYGANGVCLVDDVREMQITKNPELFYILRPISDHNSVFYIPVNNETLSAKIHPLLGREEIDALIDSARNEEVTWISDRKARMEHFRVLLRECDPRSLLILAASIYAKKQTLAAEGKKLSPSDNSVLKQAEDLTDSEFAFVLGIQPEDVGPYIRKRMGLE